uniref:Uncharacterized protein n=1 Tax=Musa acuminata subsp. malaccensis TaxID=214687 RepID=A0A804IRG2_MUSAM
MLRGILLLTRGIMLARERSNFNLLRRQVCLGPFKLCKHKCDM